MYLLYLDDSGSIENIDEDYFVLGGICLHESKVRYINRFLDDMAKQISPDNPNDIEFHASEIFGGREEPWKSIARLERIEIIKRVLNACNYEARETCLFASAIHKESFPKHEAVERAFTDLCSRFNLFLERTYRQKDEPQEGMIILDESSHETDMQTLATKFRQEGTPWERKITNIQEVPLFVDSKASRVIQLADHIAYAVFRRYNAGDINYFDVIQHRFDTEEGRIHGLSHKHRLPHPCTCPSCLSKQTPDSQLFDK